MEREAKAAEILDDFAASSSRYLWTDAFAVMTWVGLYERSGERRFLDLAQRLVAQVHEVLGVEKSDDHPTARGLRIGKPLPERRPDEPYDPELEWERDGQYYHYLTKWMHALRRIAAVTKDERYHRWAVELAKAANRAFIHPGGMYWKMSIDLSRPLVRAQGAHDPLDGLVATASLGLETRELKRICDARRWGTDDALGAGGLLLDALHLARMGMQPFLAAVLEDAEASVGAAAATLGGPATRRLGFRELGFALGLHAVGPLAEYADVSRLRRFVPLAAKLEDFWLAPANQAAATWTAHRGINAVTLAACLAPEGALA